MNSVHDIIVVGGGHAGIEAALAAARLGADTVLVTHDVRDIGRMPCNPAIGGLGKGHLVREIDILGGEMGLAIDKTGIQFRTLNLKKGPAVQSPRAQADKDLYREYMSRTVCEQEGLEVIAEDAAGLLTTTGGPPAVTRVQGVVLLSGRKIRAQRVILCTGTFLKGLMHVGSDRKVGGREGSASSERLSTSLTDLGFVLRRLKTGTPPRLARDSIDYSALQVQPGDENPAPFSFRTRHFAPEQVDCHLAYTHAGTHDLIRASLERSPLFGGVIEGQGPRYCPSIEDKVVRFADKDRHLIFLEPEGLDHPEVYVNGLSTSLPADVQVAMVRSVPGLEKAELVRMGYAIEYDSVPSWQIHLSLETKLVDGLYLAGQLLGTSGYEEAAAQGLVAGVNACRSLKGAEPLNIPRDVAYIGVLVDDLVTKEINEPYRMFTSRAEHRLHLRCDNAESRLLRLAAEIGLLPAEALEELRAREAFITEVERLCRKHSVFVQEADKGRGRRLMVSDYFRYPGVDWRSLKQQAQAEDTFWLSVDLEYKKLLNKTSDDRVVESALFQVQTDTRYDGYIAKQNRLIHNREHLDNLELPADLDYMSMTALSYEAREKLQRIRPQNMGQAGRIDGVRAGDLAVLVVYLKKLGARDGKEEERRDG